MTREQIADEAKRELCRRELKRRQSVLEQLSEAELYKRAGVNPEDAQKDVWGLAFSPAPATT